jgi:hypothetical protein
VFNASTIERSFSPIKEFILAVKMLFFGLGSDMQHDGFITLFGGTAMWPLGTHAQQPRKPATIGFLGASSANALVQSTGAFVQRPFGTPL